MGGGGDLALEIESFLGPVKWHRTDRRVPFGAQKKLEYRYFYVQEPTGDFNGV
jgi:hypothetical protein